MIGQMISCLKATKDEGNDQTFIKNGGYLLEEQVALCNGRSNPIRHFSANELMTATNCYDEGQMFLGDDGYRLYKGSLKDLPIIVKKYTRGPGWVDPYKDIAIGSQMSIHKNVLKLLGCCLETQYPTIVYEFAATKSLSTCISDTNVQPLPWKSRLKIAADLANAITYLHTAKAFSRPVIHRDVRCYNILLDENNVPKLTHFGLCMPIPEGQSHVKNEYVFGAGSDAPECYAPGYLTEKVDVYCFGMLQLEVLSGRDSINVIKEHKLQGRKKPCVKNFINVVDQRITQEGIESEQLLDFATLLLRCMSFAEEERPTMMEVAKELRRMHQSFPSPC